MRMFFWFLALLGAIVEVAPAGAVTFTQGHGDVGMWYVPGRGYELMLSNGHNWQSDPSLATIVAPQATRESVPAPLATAGSGLIAGDPLWKLPQSATEAAAEGAPWLGMQIHGGPLGAGGSSSAASANAARLSLELVSATGPGQFLMWQDLEPNLYGLGGPGGPGFESRPDLLASPAAAFNSALSAGNDVGCWNHMHTHMNWGFTAPGEYLVTLNLSGETTEDGAFSNSATFRFLVGEQSPVSPRLGDFTGDGLVDQGDLATLATRFGTTSGATAATGDLDGDGRVGLSDLIRLRNEIGSFVGPPSTTDPTNPTLPPLGTPGGSATIGGLISGLGPLDGSPFATAAAVPEPHSLAIAACGVVAALWLARRGKLK